MTHLRLPWWLRRWRICLQCRRPGFDPWVWKIPWRREWLPTPVFLPGESHGQRSLVGCSPWGHKEMDTTEWPTHVTHLLAWPRRLSQPCACGPCGSMFSSSGSWLCIIAQGPFINQQPEGTTASVCPCCLISHQALEHDRRLIAHIKVFIVHLSITMIPVNIGRHGCPWIRQLGVDQKGAQCVRPPRQGLGVSRSRLQLRGVSAVRRAASLPVLLTPDELSLVANVSSEFLKL